MRDRLGDRWLGFDDEELKRLLNDAGLDGVRVSVGARRQRDPFTVLIASGVKPVARHAVTVSTKSTKTPKITQAN